MRVANIRLIVGLIMLLTAFATASHAQTFPPVFSATNPDPNPFENSQNYSFARGASIAVDPTGDYPYLYMAYGSTSSNDYLYIGYSTDGVTWSDTAFTTLNTAYTPAIAFFDGYLWAAWISNGGGGLVNGALYIDYTNNPSSGTFDTSPIEVLNSEGGAFSPASSPTLAVFDNSGTPQLWIAAIDSFDNIDTASINGPGDSVVFNVSACNGQSDPDGYVPQETAQVGMVAFNNLMYYAYQTSGHSVRICSTNGGVSNHTYSSEGGYSAGSGVSATVYGSYLAITFKDNTGGNHQIVEGTSNGTSWTGEDCSFSMNGGNEITPSAAKFDNYYYMVFTGNSTNHRMWTAIGNY